MQAADMVQATKDAQVDRSGRMFDPYLTSSHRAVSAIADNLIANFDLFAPLRKRSMKARDRENLDAMLRAVLANLARAVAEGIDPASVHVSLRAAKFKVTRYDRRGFSGLPKVLKTVTGFQSPGGFALSESSKKGIASKVTAGPAFAETLSRFKFGPEHFAQAEGRETVCLSRSERDYVAGTVERERLDYIDTPETGHYRAEMARINAALLTADLAFEPDGGPVVLTSIRELRRCFNLSPDAPEDERRFDLGGRLFGGWWEALDKDRRHAIRIEGEPLADLDFKAMFVRLAYIEAGLAPPPASAADLYALPGFSGEDQREGIKKVTLAMLFRSSPLVRLPKDAKALLPPSITAAKVRAAILTAHPALASILETGVGLGLMFLESQILVAALLRLAGEGITALPMHDGIMCAKSKADLVAVAMEDAAEQIVGYRLPVARKA